MPDILLASAAAAKKIAGMTTSVTARNAAAYTANRVGEPPPRFAASLSPPQGPSMTAV